MIFCLLQSEVSQRTIKGYLKDLRKSLGCTDPKKLDN